MAMQRFCTPQSRVQVLVGEPKMGMKKEPIVCVSCGIEKKVPHSSVGIYCSNKCQQRHQFNTRYRKWMEGNIETSSTWLRNALKERDGHQCAMCGLSQWLGKAIVLELDHMDGNYNNNQKENLRMVCPNCHSVTPTYKNRNKGKGRPHRRKFFATEGGRL